MTFPAPELEGTAGPVPTDEADGAWVSPAVPRDDDVLMVTCDACGAHQQASGGALGYRCERCGADWQVLRCAACRKAAVVPAGTRGCPRCGHDRRGDELAARRARPRWLTEPNPLSVWLGGVRYLGGHRDHDGPIRNAGLLLDRRGIHLRAFRELFSVSWESVRGVAIEGPADISERLSLQRLLDLGAQTWITQVAYLTVQTTTGDAIFEVDGLGPPELHARLSRVLQGLQRREHPPTPIAIERVPAAPGPDGGVAPDPPATVTPVTTAAPVPAPAVTPGPQPLVLDPETSEVPIEVFVVDALWKLTQVCEAGLVDEHVAAALRAELLAQVPALSAPSPVTGPLLRV
ncbi:MAG TPA: hypothetical protein VGN59_06125 [Acidimicrobiia bacterium]|jgi:predicted RNA-binding Zn-ribbon protein involved in translation (DUF1610 family)